MLGCVGNPNERSVSPSDILIHHGKTSTGGATAAASGAQAAAPLSIKGMYSTGALLYTCSSVHELIASMKATVHVPVH